MGEVWWRKLLKTYCNLLAPGDI